MLALTIDVSHLTFHAPRNIIKQIPSDDALRPADDALIEEWQRIDGVL